MVCPPVQGDNSRALASELSPVQADKPRGWSGGAMMLGQHPLPGRPTTSDNRRAMAYCACIEKEKAENEYSGTDMYNKEYNPNSETEVIHMADEVHPLKYKTKPFDWFILSVLGYILCPFTGVCAMYYSVRANHASDWARDEEMVTSYNRKAKCLTLTSIIIGLVVMTIFIILMSITIHQLLEMGSAMAAASLQAQQLQLQQLQQQAQTYV